MPVSLPQSWFLEVFSTYGRAVLLCAISQSFGVEHSRCRNVVQLSIGIQRQAKRVGGCGVVLSDCGQAG